jgi:hypothetical protein
MNNYQNIQVRNTMKTQLTILTALVAFGVGTATAGDVTGLTTFSSGTTARASEVNGNFNAVKTAVDDNHAQIIALQALVLDLTTRLEMLENSTVQKLDGVLDLNGTTAVFSGVNLQVVDGSGTTLSTGGLGNLIVGYDAPSDDLMTPDSVKTGSHNVVIGNFHSYTSYGGLVAGYENTVSGPYSSVTGGRANTASGDRSSVSGGAANTASDTWSSVSGGAGNLADGIAASASGGANNKATGNYSSVSGGGDIDAVPFGNTASGVLSSVSGGNLNQATALSASVSGGFNNEAGGLAGTGNDASVSGGVGNKASAPRSSVSGGNLNEAFGTASSVGGGISCTNAVAGRFEANCSPPPP